MQVELRDVQLALKQDGVVPFFQPIVDLRSGKLRGFEVLARWVHPQHGPVLPSNFIAIAESHGLIDQLTRQVAHKAFTASRYLLPEHSLALNISPVQMRDLDLVAQIQESAQGTGFALSRLVVEITESALHNNLAKAQAVAASLKSLGCRLALDDFGTGYSSLRHLQSMEFDEIKIDQSFIRGMAKERSCRKIVAAIVGLGHSLGLDTIAEGVETEEDAEMLIWLGCEQAQGWRYGKAQPVQDISRMIAAPQLASVPEFATPGDDWATSSLEALPTLRLAQLQAIYDGTPVGLCFLDSKLRYVSLNRRLAEMNGMPVKSHLGRSVMEMYPELFPAFEPFLNRALQGEAISGVQIHSPSRGSGQMDRELIASYQPAWDEADEVIGISVSLLDVTDHRQPGGSVHHPLSQEFADKVHSETPWVMDGEGNDLQASSRWIQTTPLGKDKTRNLRWLEALHADDLAATIKAMKRALQTGTPIDVEYRVLGVDGAWRWMRSRGTARFAPNGEIIRWYGSVEDINDSKVSERESGSESDSSYSNDQQLLATGIAVAESLEMLDGAFRSSNKQIEGRKTL